MLFIVKSGKYLRSALRLWKQGRYPEVYVEHILNDQNPPAATAAFFDVDGTLIRGATSGQLARELYRQGFISWRDITFALRHSFFYLLFGESKLRVELIKDRALQVMAGHSEEEIKAIGEKVYQEVYQHKIFAGTLRLLRAHLQAGHQVWLVTATPHQIANVLVANLGATGALCTTVELADGMLTGRLIGPVMHGKGKAVGVKNLALAQSLDLSYCYAYGDSDNDLDILNSVGHPHAINPEPRLRIFATARSWPILDLRTRRPDLKKAAKWGKAWVKVSGTLWAVNKTLRKILVQVRAD